MKTKDWIYTHILPSAGYAAIRFYSRLLRVTVFGRQIVHDLKASEKTIVFAVIHGRQFMSYRMFRNNNLCVMSSPSRDGRLQGEVLTRFGFSVVYGSSSKSPVRAMVGMIKQMQKGGGDGIMAVDGPRGPVYKVKPGILFLAKKLNAVIVPFVFSCERAIIMKAWDKYMLPKPFSKTVVLYGSPFYPSKKTDKDAIAEECLRLETILADSMKRADAEAGYTEHE